MPTQTKIQPRFQRSHASLRTAGEIEALVCTGMIKFEKEYMGRGPKDVHAHLIGDFLVVRLKGVLTVAEHQLVKTESPEKGRDLLKQVRTHLLATARPHMENLIKEITGVSVVSVHNDISTVTGEKIIIFTLADAPPTREVRKSDS